MAPCGLKGERRRHVESLPTGSAETAHGGRSPRHRSSPPDGGRHRSPGEPTMAIDARKPRFESLGLARSARIRRLIFVGSPALPRAAPAHRRPRALLAKAPRAAREPRVAAPRRAGDPRRGEPRSRPQAPRARRRGAASAKRPARNTNGRRVPCGPRNEAREARGLSVARGHAARPRKRGGRAAGHPAPAPRAIARAPPVTAWRPRERRSRPRS